MRAQDSIRAEHAQGAYVPAPMQAKIGDLVRRGLLSEAAAKARREAAQAGADEAHRFAAGYTLFGE